MNGSRWMEKKLKKERKKRAHRPDLACYIVYAPYQKGTFFGSTVDEEKIPSEAADSVNESEREREREAQ